MFLQKENKSKLKLEKDAIDKVEVEVERTSEALEDESSSTEPEGSENEVDTKHLNFLQSFKIPKFCNGFNTPTTEPTNQIKPAVNLAKSGKLPIFNPKRNKTHHRSSQKKLFHSAKENTAVEIIESINATKKSLEQEFDEEAFHILHFGKDERDIEELSSASPSAPKTSKISVKNNKVIKRGRKKSKFYELEALHRDHQNSHHSKNIHFWNQARASKLKSIDKIKEIASDYLESEKIKENICSQSNGMMKITTDEEWRAFFSFRESFVPLNRNECNEYEKLQELKETQLNLGVKQSYNKIIISDVFSLSDEF